MQAVKNDEKVKYTNDIVKKDQKDRVSVLNLISKFEQKAGPTLEDHAIVDDVDEKRLTVILGHEPGRRELADMQDNKTDDDQPDLETDESSGEKNKMRPDVSMEGFTEATDITTPVEMAGESGLSRREDFDTSYQISDLPPEFSKHDTKINSPATLHKETLFEITDLSDLTDPEDNKEDIFVQTPSLSDRTLVPDSPDLEKKIRRREATIERKFDRLSMELSDTEINVEKEMFVKVSTQISRQEEEEAATSFEAIIFENFAEDKSEDWLTHGSDKETPDKEIQPDIFGEPEVHTDGSKQLRGKTLVGILITPSSRGRVDMIQQTRHTIYFV